MFSTVYGHVLVGPTAHDVTDRRVPCPQRMTVEQREALAEHAARVLPCLRDTRPVGEYSGLRPATEHRDYCISADEARGVINVAGIRSTGMRLPRARAVTVVVRCACVSGAESHASMPVLRGCLVVQASRRAWG